MIQRCFRGIPGVKSPMVGSEQPDFKIEVRRAGGSAEVDVFVRDAPGSLSPPPPYARRLRYDRAVDREDVEAPVAHAGREIDPSALRSRATLRKFLEALTRSRRTARAWCYESRATRLLELLDADSGSDKIVVDVRDV